MKKYKAMVLSCIDPRFQPKVYKYLKDKNLIEESDLDIALNDLEENMDEKSFENFMRIKNRGWH